MMDKNVPAGKIKQVKGAVQDARGDLTGSVEDNVKGKATKAAGEVQEKYGRVKDALRDDPTSRTEE